MKLGVFVSMMSMGLATFAEPSITEVTAVQRYPWNGKVDISYKASGIASAARENGWITSLKVTATDKQGHAFYTATELIGDLAVSDGRHTVVWDMAAQDLTFKSTNVVFGVRCENQQALYCIVDLLGGPTALSYPISYVGDVPCHLGAWPDEYKTTKLVLRYIARGSFKMGGTYDVTLTQSYYMGVFEITQKQYELVTGVKPSYFDGDLRPVECVSWNTLKGDFIAKLRKKTGLMFDLPTEAQWEYACRAGTTTTYSYGSIASRYYMWFSDNAESHTHDVGTRPPNGWGLYDMHGNAMEWCRDWFGNLSTSVNPVGPNWGTHRVVRGGSWSSGADCCDSSFRFVGKPTEVSSNVSFRLSRTLP